MRAGEIPNIDLFIPNLLLWADLLIQSDELQKAEKLLYEFLPGYYRDNPPAQVVEMRQKLHRYMMNVQDYMCNPNDVKISSVDQSVNNVNGLLRGALIKRTVEEYNKKDITPHIFDMGPGDFWLPIGLAASKFRFTYECSVLSTASLEAAKPFFQDHVSKGSGPRIFVACELIEHLRDERDIVHSMNKYCPNPEEVHLSTPLYTFGGGVKDWDSKPGLGQHMRTYTPHEFMAASSTLFPGYTFEYYPSEVQSVVGKKNA